MNTRTALCWLSLGLCTIGAVQAQEKRALPGMTYESLRDLPDWSGWWGLPEPMPEESRRQPLPLPPDVIARMLEVRTTDADPKAGRYCRPPQFVGYSGGFVDSVEFLFTPGRVTLTTELGLLRRIYTDGRSLADKVEPTNTGTSVGHWEGTTLVVETVGVSPTASYPAQVSGSMPIGRNVRIIERIHLTPEKNLQFDVVTEAPDILLKPDSRSRVYTRVDKRAATEVSFCADNDRSVDPVSGKQRFDMTPPADMPPPPAND